MTSEVKPALKKMLPWLKRLKGDLDDDDSSDSTSQQSEVTPKKMARDTKSGEGGKRLKKRRREESGSAGKRSQSEGSAASSVAAPKAPSALENPVVRPPRAAASKVETRLDIDGQRRRREVNGRDWKLQMAQRRPSRLLAQQRQKRRRLESIESRSCVLKDTTQGEGTRLSVFKLKRQQSNEALKVKERDRMRVKRARTVSGIDADVEDEVNPRPLVGKRVTIDKSGVHKSVASKKVHVKEKLLVATSVADSPERVGSEEEDIAGSAVIAKDVQVDTAKINDDENIKCSVVAIEQLEPVENKEERVEISNVESVAPAESLKVKPDDNDENAETTKGITSGDNAEYERQATPVTAVNTSVVVVKHEEVHLKSRAIPSDTTSESTELEKGRVMDPTTNKSLSGPAEAQNGDKETKCAVKNEQVLPDAMPIPRKTAERGPATIANTSAFVIPKRSFAKPVSQKEIPRGQVDIGTKRSLQSRVPVVLKPLPSPETSPQFSKPDSIRPQRRRTKNPVPVKHVAISKLDRVMMRLSKRRNSIFMATAELAVQSTKTSEPRTIGYEVFDVHGKVLPDLIPRLNCATKSEITSNRDSYTASFFGVSLSAPKCKEKESTKPDENFSDGAKTREINCYEKLRFERPQDRDFYQQRMYGTTFVPQSLRGWITVIIRKARFERRSTGIRFNQDRDREEFAASLVKRYTVNKSVPRCDIPRENWQRLIKNQPGTVYLHYYNREDAKQASQVFRDDLGNPLQLKTEYKAGVVISPSSSPAADVRFQNTPRRSCSSERSAPRPSPLISQNGSVRSTPLQQQDRFLALKNGNRSSRYDRGPPPAASPWSRDGSRFGPSLSGNKRSRRSRSRSRSRSKPLPDEPYDPAAQKPGASSISVESNTHLQKPNDEVVPDNCEGAGARSRSGDSTLAQRRNAYISPPRPSNSCQERYMRETGTHNDQRGNPEREKKPEAVRAHPSGNNDRRKARQSRSPPRGRWTQQPNHMQNSERRDDRMNNARGQSRENVTEYRQDQEKVNRPQNNMSRSRSRPRHEMSPSFGVRGGGRDAPYIKERRRSHDFMSNDGKGRGERVQSNTNRYGGRGYRNRGSNDLRGGGAYSQP